MSRRVSAKAMRPWLCRALLLLATCAWACRSGTPASSEAGAEEAGVASGASSDASTDQEGAPDGGAFDSGAFDGAAANGALDGATDGGVAWPDDFEGEVLLSEVVNERVIAHAFGFDIKRPRVRIDARSGAPRSGHPRVGGVRPRSVVLIVDPSQKKASILLPSERKAASFDYAKIAGAAADGGAGGRADAGADAGVHAVPKKTGRDAVAGYLCDVWTMALANGRTLEICGVGVKADDVVAFNGTAPQIAVAVALTQRKWVPLRAIQRNPKGQEDWRLIASRIERRPVDAARFEIPKSYEVVPYDKLLAPGDDEPPSP